MTYLDNFLSAMHIQNFLAASRRYLALDNNLTILPVLNKIDLPSADPDMVKREIEEIIGLDASEACLCSAKTGQGVPEILEAIVAKVPPPSGDATAGPG